MDRPHRLGAQLRHTNGHARFVIQRAIGGIGVTCMHKEKLDIRRCELWAGFDEGMRQARPQGQNPSAGGQILCNRHDKTHTAGLLIQRHRFFHPPIHARAIMVLIVMPHSSQSMPDRNTDRCQMRGITDTRYFENLRRLHSPRRHHYFTRSMGRIAL